MSLAPRTFVSPFGSDVPLIGARPSLVDVQELLRRRLRFILLVVAAFLAGFFSLGVVARWTHFRSLPQHVLTDPPYFGVYLVIAVVFATTGALLTRRHPSLRALRAIEGVTWLSTTTTLAALTIAILSSYDETFFAKIWLPLAMGFSVPGATFIILYGVFIPNSWRRCAVFITLIAILFTVPDALALVRHGTLIPGGAGYLVLKAMIISMFAVIAIYGAHRLEVLTQDALAARMVGPYTLKKSLGEGGMGEVYLAEHQLLRRPCAVKLIRPDQAGDESSLARFEREVQATAALTHPNTVHIYDYGRADDGSFFYAMEYLPGTSLEQLIARDGPLPPERAIHFLLQLCGALGEAHSHGLIHRDIKPGNVIVCERGGIPDVVKLLDFGLVMPVVAGVGEGRLTVAGTIVGSPEFMSPEQCGGAEELTPASDIYSVGALGYFLLTGQSPFAGRAPLHMLAAHLYEEPSSLIAAGVVVPSTLAAALMRCLAKIPDERFPDVATLAEALRSRA